MLVVSLDCIVLDHSDWDPNLEIKTDLVSLVWRTGQIECLANDSSCHPFKNAGQVSKAIFVVFETAKASVIVFLLDI